jgi:hypothetical protein
MFKQMRGPTIRSTVFIKGFVNFSPSSFCDPT